MTPQQIINETCREYGTSHEAAFVLRKMHSECVLARRETFVALYMTGLSTHQVAAATGFEQPTVWHALRRAGVQIRATQHAWTEREIALLGTGPDTLVCDEINLYASRKIPGFHKRSRVAIVMKRNQLGIPSYKTTCGVSDEARMASRKMNAADWCNKYGFHQSTYYATRKR